jgi:hypothetical protein
MTVRILQLAIYAVLLLVVTVIVLIAAPRVGYGLYALWLVGGAWLVRLMWRTI